MADQAVGRTCPNDGTLTACSGSYSDENLVGVCAYCSGAVITLNPYYKKPATDTEPEEVADEQQAASIHNYAAVTPPPVLADPVSVPDDEMEPEPAAAALSEMDEHV